MKLVKRAGGAAVVGLLGGGLDLLPHRDRGGVAVDAGHGAEGQRARRVGDAGGEEPLDRDARTGRPGGSAWRSAWHISMSYTGEPGVDAQVHLAEELGVVGDGGEVERAGRGAPLRVCSSLSSENAIVPPRGEVVGVARAGSWCRRCRRRPRSGCGRAGRRRTAGAADRSRRTARAPRCAATAPRTGRSWGSEWGRRDARCRRRRRRSADRGQNEKRARHPFRVVH